MTDDRKQARQNSGSRLDDLRAGLPGDNPRVARAGCAQARAAASSIANRLAICVGGLAAGALVAVSVLANARYGISLGATAVDKGVYATTSVAIDVAKVMLPLALLAIWRQAKFILAIATALLWVGCVFWSSASAVGFALSTRADAVAERAAEAKMRAGWGATVDRAESQLSALGRHRPSAVVQADLAAVSIAPTVWARTRQCSEITLPESRAACEPVLRLRQELAAAEAAEQLERRVAAGQTQLASAGVVGLTSDPQAAALARLTGADQPTVRTALALLLAGLVEAGSALGFTILAMASNRDPPPVPTDHKPDTCEPAAPRTRRAATFGRTELRAPTRAGATDDMVHRWALTRLDVAPGAAIAARAAYADFAKYAHAHGLHPLTETAFGRSLTAAAPALGGRKVKRRDRAYYIGFAIVGMNEITADKGCRKAAAFSAGTLSANATALAR